MKYLDYMKQNPEQNFTWCKPYTNDSETHYLVVYDGIAHSIETPDITAHRYGGGNFDETLEQLAREVNPDYDLYSGYDDTYIALQSMHEIGCWHCPFRDECEAMGEEVSATDNR